ncbi:hypothetical protein [Sinorhizobium fredii]|uniref:hypothetical protein n=1 Tax=Rhizobium fredii TaxID=380 RepID=UPI000D5A3C97|nr:hypothetical protein [Sinorhizobium fredii]AWI60742.1 hypothetical protein AB395_00005565 [Sinorhizobium fredii CCBAU 45436]
MLAIVAQAHLSGQQIIFGGIAQGNHEFSRYQGRDHIVEAGHHDAIGPRDLT